MPFDFGEKNCDAHLTAESSLQHKLAMEKKLSESKGYMSKKKKSANNRNVEAVKAKINDKDRN